MASRTVLIKTGASRQDCSIAFEAQLAWRPGASESDSDEDDVPVIPGSEPDVSDFSPKETGWEERALDCDEETCPKKGDDSDTGCGDLGPGHASWVEVRCRKVGISFRSTEEGITAG